MRHHLLYSLAIGFLSLFAIVPAQAQWVHTNGPSGISCFAVSGTNLFAGGGPYPSLYLSTDSGSSWTPLTDPGILPLALTALGTNLVVGGYGSNYNVRLSTDNGTNWIVVADIGLTDSQVNALAVVGTNLFAGTSLLGSRYDGQIFRSTDSSTSWTALTHLDTSFVNALAVNGTNLFAGTNLGNVFRSSDNGANWTEASFNSGLNGGSIIALAVSGSNLFAVTCCGGLGGGGECLAIH